MVGDSTAGPAVGLVGDDGALEAAVRDSSERTTAASVDAVLDADPDVVVAVGEPAALALARRQPTVPVLPVDAGTGLRSIPRAALAAAIGRYDGAEWNTIAHPLLSVSVEDTELALMDAGLVTADPATIATYAIAAHGESVGTVRADGVHVSTPAGTSGYAAALDVPLVSPGEGVLAVTPIAPFQTDPDAWILPNDGLAVTVERADGPVAVLADDRTCTEIDPGTTTTIHRAGTVETVVVPESGSPFVR